MPLFARLTSAELNSVLGSGEVRRLVAGDTLFRAGDPADALFVVLGGELSVSVSDDSDARVELNTVQTGGYVGEVALLDGGPRSATVTATQATELFALSRAAFVRLLQASPHLLSTVLENLTRTVRTSTDRVVQERLEQRVMQADMELARHRALTEMVAGLAHEINTPLGIVRTAATLLRTRLASGQLDDVAEASTLIERNIERAHRLIEEFKKLSVSQVSDTLEVLDFGDVVREVVELYSISARQAHLRIDIDDRIRGDRAWRGYRGRFSQVMLNVLTNIDRYAYPDGVGGDVVIVVDRTEDGFVLSVADHGKGIAPEHLPRVFDPFFTTGRARGGSGLGLAIVHSLVRDGLGGSIDISSQLNVGTTVTIRVPREAPRAD